MTLPSESGKILKEGSKGHEPSIERTFFIVGSSRVQNELISYYIARETGADCLIYEKIRQLPIFDNAISYEQVMPVLWDCLGKDPEQILIELGSCDEQALSQSILVLLHVTLGLGFEEKLVWKGVRGFIYEQDSLNQLLRCIRAVFNGEIWLSRKIMAKCLLRHKSLDHPNRERRSILTPREGEILRLLATWSRNDEIAERLHISSHTVKTHLYNIFRKINVSNRGQAVLWAAKNL